MSTDEDTLVENEDIFWESNFKKPWYSCVFLWNELRSSLLAPFRAIMAKVRIKMRLKLKLLWVT